MTTPKPTLKQNGMPGNDPPVTRITIARAHKGEHSFVGRETERETERERERDRDRDRDRETQRERQRERTIFFIFVCLLLTRVME